MRSSRVLWVACLAQLLVVLDISIVNVALPSIQRSFGLTPAMVSWVALAYTLGFAGALLVGARLGDLLGPARVLTWAMAAFACASLLGGIAAEGVTLIIARAVQGLCAAMASPATLTLLTITYAEGRGRVSALAVWTGVSLAGGGVGSVLGGVLTQWASWRSVFLIAVPLCLVAVLGARPIIQSQPVRRDVRIPVGGALIVTAAFIGMTYALSGFSGGIAQFQWWIAAAVSLILAGSAIVHQRRTAHPLIPEALWQNRSIVTGNIAIFTTGMCFQVSVWFFLTFLMQQQLGYGPFATGLAFLPLTVTMLAVNTWATPALARRMGARTVAFAGALVAAAGFAAQAVVPMDGLAVVVLLPSLIIGIGGGLFNAPLTAIVTSGVKHADAGAASGLMNISKQFGGAVGVAILSATNALFASDQAAFAAMAALMGISALMVLAIPSRERALP